MNIELLENISLQLDIDRLIRQMRVRDQDGQRDRFVELVNKAQEIARPMGVFREAYISEKSDNQVVIDEVQLSSKILRINLGQAHRVFIYLATCGREMEDWAKQFDDMLEQFWVSELMQTAALQARQNILEHIHNRYQPGKMASMNPGSLEDWPIHEQQHLFRLLGDGPRRIGVHLTDSFLMVPIKSVSGLRFPTEVNFENCMLCPREKCPGRRAPYNPDLYAQKYESSMKK